ncbi:MAG: hypothetical protein PWP27_39 [Clostridiales bacterium]|jgi:hypothetical protein|nr:hypothetical protein [Clostridiales bacterium]MDK2932229.1 hypothetical protein [Clostridiales bacterium]
MRINRIINYIALTLILFLVITNFSACSKKSAKSAPKNISENEKKVPDSLKELESGIQDIIDELDKKENTEKSEAKVKIESKTEMKQESDKDKSKNEMKEETKEEIKKESPQDKQWKSVTQKVESLHKQWNSLQPEVVKAGIPKKVIDEFSNSLNTLTTYTQTEDKQNTLFYANELYRLIPDFMEQYHSKTPPDLKRIGYFVRDAKYNGMINQWEKSKSSINNLKSHWSIVKAQVKKEQEKQASTMEFSIYELEKVILLSDINLTTIKSDIVLENLKKLEESFEK